MDPFVFGEYPKSMRELVKERLPEFTEEEKVMVKGSLDFLAINYYASSYAKNKPPSPNEVLRYTLDVEAEIIGNLPHLLAREKLRYHGCIHSGYASFSRSTKLIIVFFLNTICR